MLFTFQAKLVWACMSLDLGPLHVILMLDHGGLLVPLCKHDRPAFLPPTQRPTFL